VLAHHTSDGLLASLGALPAVNADRGGPYRMRIRRMAYSTVGTVLGLLVGQAILGDRWTIIVVVSLLSLASGVVAAIGASWSLLSLNALVYVAIATAEPLGRPLWFPALLALAGAGWALALSIPGWVVKRDEPERMAVAGAYQAIATLAEHIGTPAAEGYRMSSVDAFSAAEDALVAARVRMGGSEPSARRLLAVLQASGPVVEAVIGRMTAQRPPESSTIALIRTVAGSLVPGRTWDLDEAQVADPRGPDQDVRRPLAGAVRTIREGRAAATPAMRPSVKRRARWRDELTIGRSAWMAAVRLTMCMAVAEVLRTYLFHNRSYWIPLTVAVVMKPDFGSVFARGVQRAVGTTLGVVVGAAVVAAVPGTTWLLPFLALFAALLPITVVRNYGMFVTVLTPIVLIQIDALTNQPHPAIVGRLVDTLVGCAVVLVGGYLAWPDSWRPHLNERYAEAAERVADYAASSLHAPGHDQWPLRRGAYRSVSDLRTALQRAFAEPTSLGGGQARALWPAAVALERITDEVTATALRLRTSSATPTAVDQVVDEVRGLGALAIGRSTKTPTATTRKPRSQRDHDDPLGHLHQEVEAARRALESSRPIRPPAPPPSKDGSDLAGRPGSDA
jgi:uncharacterized membrane protein YccC